MIDFIVYIFLFIIGAVIGSFTNVLIDRIPSQKFLSKSRSYCESCKKTLQWYDLFPLVSYLFLRGKCRHCKNPIPLRIFFVELLMGITFVLLYLLFPASIEILMLMFIVCAILVAIFFIDAKHRIIPDSLLLSLLLTTLLYHIFSKHELIPYLLAGIGSFLFFLLLFLVTKGKGMGFGDVKFTFIIGFLLGFPAAVISLYAAFLTGAIISIILIVTGKKKARGSVIAFGPFLIIGIIIAALYTNEIISIFF